MSVQGKRKFIADHQLQKSDEFQRICSNFTVEGLKSLIQVDPSIVHKCDEKTGWSLLYKAVITGSFPISELLLDHNANPNVQNIYGETPLHQAIENGKHNIINLLLEKGSDPNIQQLDGETPIHIAAVRGDHKVIKLLLLYGANPYIITRSGYSAYDYANERHNDKCIEVLKPLMEKQSQSNNPGHKDGFQTAKNSEGQFNRVRENIDMNTPHLYNINNTSRHTSKISYNTKFYSRLNLGSNSAESEPGYAPVEDMGYNPKNHTPHSSSNLILKENRRERNRSCNLNNYTNHKMVNFSTANEDPLKDSGTFMNQMCNFEERLERMKKELIEASNMEHPINEEPELENKPSRNSTNDIALDEDTAYNTAPIQGDIGRNFRRNSLVNYNTIGDKPDMLSYMNFANLIKTHKKTQSSNQNFPTFKRLNINSNMSNSRPAAEPEKSNLIHVPDNRVMTLKPEELADYYDMNNENMSRITLTTMAHNLNDEIYNLPLQNANKNYNNYSKIAENYWNSIEWGQKPSVSLEIVTEVFVEENPVLAVFLSSVNDIIEEEEVVYEDGMYNMGEEGGYVQTEEQEEEEGEGEEEAYTLQQNTDRKTIKYFSKSHRSRSIKEDAKPISLDTETIHETSLNYYINPNLAQSMQSSKLQRGNSTQIEIEYNSTEAMKEIHSFLKILDLERYTPLFIKNGYDDLTLILDQMKSDMSITDDDLCEIGINLPGHRAKILIKLEEECNNFKFSIPRSVYYTIPSNGSIQNDSNIKTLNNWLTNLKLDQFLNNFIENGYHSLELLFMQMASKNVLTGEILESELKIDKVGHKSRLLNRLIEESKKFISKLKSSDGLVITDKTDVRLESCKCGIF